MKQLNLAEAMFFLAQSLKNKQDPDHIQIQKTWNGNQQGAWEVTLCWEEVATTRTVMIQWYEVLMVISAEGVDITSGDLKEVPDFIPGKHQRINRT